MPQNLNYYKVAMDTLYEVSKELSSSITQTNTMDNVLQILENSIDVRHAMILLYNEQERYLYIESSTGMLAEEAAEVRYRPGEGAVGKVFQIGMPMMIHDIASEPIFLNRITRKDTEPLSFIAVPIKDEMRTVGVLAVDKNTRDFHSYSADMYLLKMISNLLASFIKKAKQIEHERAILLEEKTRLEKEVRQKYRFEGLIGTSKIMQQVFQKIALVGKTKSTVMIRGESGTGKEVIAKTIHFNGERADYPFIAVNCAAIPKDLIESELFGHEKGAFTGATSDKKGKFELADKGTIFLDEIGDMPLDAQSKLLRVLQEMQVERVGGSKSIKIDVRVIAATNKNLEEEIKEQRFRLDLYYRLNVVTLLLPPLRERKEDIPLLAEHIVKRFSKQYSIPLKLAPEAALQLTHCSWPGNIRELENCLERSMLNTEDGVIKSAHLSCIRGDMCYSHFIEATLADNSPAPVHGKPVAPAPTPAPAYSPADDAGEESGDDDAEKAAVIRALQESGYVQAKAARLLGLTVRQLNYRIKKFNINMKRF